MESNLLKACLHSRNHYETITAYVDSDKYSREFKYLVKFIGQYYARDREAGRIDLSVLKAQIAESVDNDKHVERFHNILDTAAASDTSIENVIAIILLAKQQEVSISLATALANEAPPAKIDELLEELKKVRSATSLQDLEGGEDADIMENIDVGSIVSSRLASGNILELYPKILNDKIDGGLEGGDHVVLYGPTEIGKSAFSIQAAAGFAFQGARGLYLINEDKTARMAQRVVSCLSGMDKYQIERDPATAQRKANDRGLGNIIMVGITPGSLHQIDRLFEQYKPRWSVLDQLRNISTGTKNNKVVQLDEAASGYRNLLKAHNAAGISVTQAGDSATNKIFLEVGDVDFSNVGIPASADLMVGIGADQRMLAANERGVSLPKNKLSGDHAKFIVRLVPTLSQVRNVGA